MGVAAQLGKDVPHAVMFAERVRARILDHGRVETVVDRGEPRVGQAILITSLPVLGTLGSGRPRLKEYQNRRSTVMHPRRHLMCLSVRDSSVVARRCGIRDTRDVKAAGTYPDRRHCRVRTASGPSTFGSRERSLPGAQHLPDTRRCRRLPR